MYTHPLSLHRDKSTIDGQACFYEWMIADYVKHVEAVGLSGEFKVRYVVWIRNCLQESPLTSGILHVGSYGYYFGIQLSQLCLLKT